MQIHPLPSRTPVARSVALSKNELSSLYKLRSLSHLPLESIAEHFGCSLYFLDIPHAHAAIYQEKGCKPEIWMREADEITNRICLGHELHHLWHAPSAVAFAEFTDFQIARYETRATLFGALFAIPSLPHFECDDDVYRIFGPDNAFAALCWLTYYRATRIEV
jgi:hypothetical protein